MMLPCPRCGQENPIAPGSADRAYHATCTRCGSPFAAEGAYAVHRDFRGMTVYCGQCGRRFPFAASCPSCATLFAGYLLVAPDESRHTVISSGWRPSAAKLQPRREPSRPTAHRTGTAIPLRLRIGAAILAVVLIPLLAGMVLHHRRQAERAYLKNYVLALYCMKSGFDHDNAFSSGYLTDWRNSAERNLTPPLQDMDSLSTLESIKGEVDKIMGRLNDPPEQLRDAGSLLGRLYDDYNRQYALVRQPSGSINSYDRSLQAAQQGFSTDLEQLRASLPAPLRAQVTKDARKYDLQFLEPRNESPADQPTGGDR